MNHCSRCGIDLYRRGLCRDCRDVCRDLTEPTPPMRRVRRPKPVGQKRGTYPRDLHGHRRGYRLHIAAGEIPCDRCQTAQDRRRKSQAEYARRKRAHS